MRRRAPPAGAAGLPPPRAGAGRGGPGRRGASPRRRRAPGRRRPSPLGESARDSADDPPRGGIDGNQGHGGEQPGRQDPGRPNPTEGSRALASRLFRQDTGPALFATAAARDSAGFRPPRPGRPARRRSDVFQELVDPGDHRLRIFQQAGGDEGVVEDLLGDELRHRRLRLPRGREVLDDGVARIELQFTRGRRVVGALAFIAFIMRRMCGDMNLSALSARAGESTRRSLAFTSATRLAERFLEPRGQRFVSSSLSAPSPAAWAGRPVSRRHGRRR